MKLTKVKEIFLLISDLMMEPLGIQDWIPSGPIVEILVMFSTGNIVEIPLQRQRNVSFGNVVNGFEILVCISYGLL